MRRCDGACKKAFDRQATSCLRGYIPLLMVGGFTHSALASIMNACAPNDRQRRVNFHFSLMVDASVLSNAPLQVAAVDYALDVVKSDPQLFPGFNVSFTYDLFNASSPDSGDVETGYRSGISALGKKTDFLYFRKNNGGKGRVCFQPSSSALASTRTTL